MSTVENSMDYAQLESTPFHQFLCKIHTLCNLDCKYCYVYHHADQSWKTKPKVMSRLVVDTLCSRICDHVKEYEIPDVTILLHGGEPMLAGVDFIDYFATKLQTSINPYANVYFGMQSNGTLLSPQMLEILGKHNIRTGVSLDGSKKTNDYSRLDRRGKSSYAAAAAAITKLKNKELLGGILCTISLDCDPIETYYHLASFDPPMIEFNLPLGNYDHLPPKKKEPFNQTPYADWLIPIFDIWYREKAKNQPNIRIFKDIMKLLLGGKSSVETIGLAPVDLVVIEANGALEAVDTLKTVAEGAPDLDMNIFQHSFTQALEHPLIKARQSFKLSLSDTCLNCTISEVCGGGYFPTRYGNTKGYRNPSVYCADYYKLIWHIRSTILESLQLVGIQPSNKDLVGKTRHRL